MITCSLNEIETYGRRAARGSGMCWGLAEEAGSAARWLAERDLPGVQLLAGLLTANAGRRYESMAPTIHGGRWRASDGELCPLCSGATLRDRIHMLAPGDELCMERLAYPLLLAPFLDQSRRPGDACCELRWADVRVSVSSLGVALACSEDSACWSECADEVRVLVSAGPEIQPTHHPRIAGVGAPISAWRAINALAERTYVPASEESRARGAGAGSIDND